MSATAEQKLEKRKLDALKRGIHRIGQEQTVPFSINLVGIGKAGADVVAEVLTALPPEGPMISALAVDIGDQDMTHLREVANGLPEGRADVRTIALDVPPRDELFATLRRYREFLKLEYPRYYWNPNYEAWLPAGVTLPEPGQHFPRALSKAIYGRAYYDGERVLTTALRDFSDRIDRSGTQSVVCIIFGMGGGTGSGIAVDLARHLSNVAFGRRALVVGIGIMPCDGDIPDHRSGAVFAALNELDCMGDQKKNEGVIAVWGDLDRNPFTGGVILVPQAHVWQATQDLEATHKRVDRELAALLARDNGADLVETLRLLNWVGAPPTQHAAARTGYGSRWAHLFGFADVDGPIKADADLPAKLGLRPGYVPTFLDPRSLDATLKAEEAVAGISAAFTPAVTPEMIEGGLAGSVQFVLPCVDKVDLTAFHAARDVYDQGSWEEKLLGHSWLLDLGVMLCEPAIRFEGMAGECLWGCACWVVVPYEDIRGEKAAAPAVAPVEAIPAVAD